MKASVVSAILLACCTLSSAAIIPGERRYRSRKEGNAKHIKQSSNTGLRMYDSESTENELSGSISDVLIHSEENNQNQNTISKLRKRAADSPLESFLLSISMIAVSEIGDKTFLVATIMAMRYPRALVFSSSFAALGLMTALSGLLGHTLPTLLSTRVTRFLAAFLFLVFGTKLLRECLATSKGQGVENEMNEVEEEISAKAINTRSEKTEGGSKLEKISENSGSKLSRFGKKALKLCHNFFSPTWIQIFVMTFLGEWGDRSQIATIALAAGSDYFMVIIGGILGHAACSGIAVVGGKYLASKISVRTILMGGTIAFYIFSLTYFYSAYYFNEEAEVESAKKMIGEE
ncbi:hypothetical protein HII13_001749 [Brettanomyces bruxellensis]|uniref:GDT1 family protein n=1 Tax=Dekkera bruxellensis TaxID=5007 RepID=A0A8H6BNB6_DEKBR|nr:hypothetical protein HII13_001749 [Brettanomyces bruxellensis]KAF6015003.1 hypothetical protein HII12_001056 [Brettanomyces bruxellensis]